MTFKVVTAILNFYIPTTCMVVLYVRIFLAIKRRSNDIARLGLNYASGAASAGGTASTGGRAAADAEADVDANDTLTDHENLAADEQERRRKKRAA